MLSKEGSDSTAGVFLTFRPDSVLTWLNHAAAVLRQPLASGAGEQVQWTRELQSVGGGGHFALGRTIKQGKLKDDRWLALAQGPHGWSLKLSGKEADSLLTLLFVTASQAGFLEAPDRPFSADSVDVPVQIIHQPTPEFRGEYGRVWVQFVVDTAGRADPTTFVAILASSPALAEQARRVILASRFKPALRHGEPVRQLVQQTLGWRFR